ncbi:MAG: class I SAM-dependent methyltransferase [Sulfuricella sp.]|jgi:ubiquinone/menaquinone biosynthesis C-methylase UbiE|nr:class I SAM-dependent methyltransferase [Sulfuricella sp.]
MIISNPHADLVCDERDIYEQLLSLQGADILELGCGRAEKTRAISQNGKARTITALEVDEIQHAANLRNNDLANVTFRLGGAEAIPALDESFDIVLMFKSLHHVPVARMDRAMAEIARVLRPGGLAYISEPVFAGEFNEILRLFHDEKVVREAAFSAVERAVSAGVFELERQIFFSTPSRYETFEHFEERILKVTHTEHRLSPDLYRQVRERFLRHMTPQGADFEMPLRVDLLRKP